MLTIENKKLKINDKLNKNGMENNLAKLMYL